MEALFFEECLENPDLGLYKASYAGDLTTLELLLSSHDLDFDVNNTSGPVCVFGWWEDRVGGKGERERGYEEYEL